MAWATLVLLIRAMGSRKDLKEGLLKDALRAYSRRAERGIDGFIGFLADLPEGVSKLTKAQKLASDLSDQLIAKIAVNPLPVGESGDRSCLDGAEQARKWITPKKLVDYLDDVPERERGGVYSPRLAIFPKPHAIGLDKVRELGFSEAHLWGKAEIEDVLFLSKNNYLLFAYFGFSLQRRRRSLKNPVQSRLAMKREAVRHLVSNTALSHTSLRRFKKTAKNMTVATLLGSLPR